MSREGPVRLRARGHDPDHLFSLAALCDPQKNRSQPPLLSRTGNNNKKTDK
jgi:hypothetical protein